MTEKLLITEMKPDDWPAVRDIYRDGIQTKQATFETAVPSWPEWNAARRPDCRLVVRQGSRIIGWAALNPVSRRAVYAGVAEVGIYIAEQTRGQGVGRRLLEALIEASEEAGIWTLQASVFPENKGSVRLFEGCGFRNVGYRKHIARHEGQWQDTILLERRSLVVGV